MIPDKLYIPTSSSNFNSLMASESISPASFYRLRNFGYKRFEKVPPNSLDNGIQIYSELPFFEIAGEEGEQLSYPLVIEVSSSVLDKEKLKPANSNRDSFLYPETIYFTPFNTRLLFFNENQKKEVLLNTEMSIETKLTHIYQRLCFVLPSDIRTFKWYHTTVEDFIFDASLVEQDNKRDRQLGLLYGSFLGKTRSTSKDIVLFKNLTGKLYNVLSAAINNPTYASETLRTDSLKQLYASIEKIVLQEDPARKKIENVLNKKENYYTGISFEDILEKENLYEMWSKLQLSKIEISRDEYDCFAKATSILEKALIDLNSCPSVYTFDKFKKAYDPIEELFSKRGTSSEILSNLLKQKNDDYAKSSFIEVLRKENLYEHFLKKTYREEQLTSMLGVEPFVVRTDQSFAKQKSRLDFYIKGLLDTVETRKTISTSNVEPYSLPFIEEDGIRIEREDVNSQILLDLYNSILERKNIRDILMQDRYSFTDIESAIIKKACGDLWMGSATQSYINGLRKNLNEIVPFDIHSTDDLLLKSFAIFCQKATNDIERLEENLISNEIADFQIAFELWGLVFGFSQLPKTIFSNLFSDEKRFSEVYQQFYFQVHQKRLEGNFPQNNTRRVPQNRVQSIAEKDSDSISLNVRSSKNVLFIKDDENIRSIISEHFSGSQTELNKILKYLSDYLKKKINYKSLEDSSLWGTNDASAITGFWNTLLFYRSKYTIFSSLDIDAVMRKLVSKYQVEAREFMIKIFIVYNPSYILKDHPIEKIIQFYEMSLQEFKGLFREIFLENEKAIGERLRGRNIMIGDIDNFRDYFTDNSEKSQFFARKKTEQSKGCGYSQINNANILK